MRFLSDMTPKHTEYIRLALNDVEILPEDTSWAAEMSEKLKDNPSLYQFESGSLDILCGYLIDMCHELDDMLREADDTPDDEHVDEAEFIMEYRGKLEEILSLLQK